VTRISAATHIDNLLIAIALDDTLGDLGFDLRRKPRPYKPFAMRHRGQDRTVFAPSVKLDVELPGASDIFREITREQFRTTHPTRHRSHCRALQPSSERRQPQAEQIDEVVLVGGSTRIPKVRALVKELFHREPNTDMNPDEWSRWGRRQLTFLAAAPKQPRTCCCRCQPLSLGIEVAGGVTDKIICATQPFPRRQHSTTPRRSTDRQNSRFTFCKASANSQGLPFARPFDLKGIPPMAAGMARIEVKF